jgi:hypothetical protein
MEAKHAPAIKPSAQDQHDHDTQYGDLGGRVGRRGIGEASAC